MVTNISPAGPNPLPGYSATGKKTGTAPNETKSLREDSVQFGQSSLSTKEAQNVVYERAMEKLRAVVEEARLELGVPEGVILDPSPEATAERILGFALNFFDKYAQNNELNDDEEGRRQFVDFIGAAINQGIGEARDILGALNAMNPEVTSNIDKTAEVIQQGLDNFIKNGLQRG